MVWSLLNIHKDIDVDEHKLIDKFASMKPRRMQLKVLVHVQRRLVSGVVFLRLFFILFFVYYRR